MSKAPASPAPAPATTAPAPAAATPAPAAARPATTTAPLASTPAAPAVTTTKVFVGNLSFSTKKEDLEASFSPAGKVLSANIISRGSRSLGYGFVEFASEAEANKAVTLRNKTDLQGRTINVEVARPRDETAEKPKREEGGYSRRRGGFNRRRGGPVGGAVGGAPGAGVPASEERRGGEGYARRGGYSRGGRGTGAPRGGARTHPAGVPAERKPENRSESVNTLFVANLPFTLDDDSLLGHFKPHGAIKAHVVKKRNGRSKGFGFVTFKSGEEQKKAYQAMDKQQVGGRELIVKIALTEPTPEGGKAPAAPSSTAAPASTPAPAATTAPAPAADKK